MRSRAIQIAFASLALWLTSARADAQEPIAGAAATPTTMPASRPRLGLHVSVATDPAGVITRTVQKVDPDSPAVRAGLRAGDVIRTVAGRPAAEMNEQDMRSALGTSTVIVLNIEREGAPRRMTIDVLSPVDRMKENQREVEARLAEMSAALMRGDGKTVAAAYSDDGIILGPTREEARGREALDQYWGKTTAKTWKLDGQPIDGGRDVVTQRGRSTLVTVRDGEEKTSIVEFMLIWKRDDLGRLRIGVDAYWPASAPPGPETP